MNPRHPVNFLKPDCPLHQDCDYDTGSDGRGLRRERKRNFLPSNAADVVNVTLIITEQVRTVEHQDPGRLCVAFEGRGRPIR